MKKDGGNYHATYDFESGLLKTDYNNAAIMDSLIELLGLDKSKVIYTKILPHCGEFLMKTEMKER